MHEARNVERLRLKRQANREARAVLARTARAVVRICFAAVPGLNGVAVSLFLPMMQPTMGHLYDGCVLSVLAERTIWERIVHPNVSDENALRNFTLNFRVGSDGEIQEVPPILPPSNANGDSKVIYLRGIDPLVFESVVQDLLSRMGYVTKLTKASHDGGVDIEAVNPQPVVGGKVVVQCKRYQTTIGVATVRELYGVVTAAKATKGVLVTTSDFSADAYAFADDKPIELINGARLTELLRRHGFDVR
ncbi:MAG TPA: restriction endonuclease [Chloroflexota bacterium]|nr:restriction endonuclease [Chloroflexota bacterium]